MFRKFLTAILCVKAASYAGTSVETASSDEECLNGPKHMRTSVRYTSPKGIGYSTGYSTLEGFFSSPMF